MGAVNPDGTWMTDEQILAIHNGKHLKGLTVPVTTERSGNA